MSSVIESTRGSDVTFSFIWDGGLIDSTVSVFEAHPLIADNISITVTDEVEGEVHCRIEWMDYYLTNTNMGFRIRVSKDSYDEALPQIMVRYV